MKWVIFEEERANFQAPLKSEDYFGRAPPLKLNLKLYLKLRLNGHAGNFSGKFIISVFF